MNYFRWLPWVKMRSSLFGHDLCFAVPRRELGFRHNSQAFEPTKSDRCGEETLAFYDSAYDVRSGVVLDANRNESAWIALKAQCEATGIAEELSLARRRFIYCDEGSELNHFLDIWVHRNGHCGDLREPANLREAAEVYIAQESLAKDAATEQGVLDDGELFGEGGRECNEVHGVNWRQMDMCGRRWQLYEEYHQHRYFGESWLLPLGEKHFLRVHLYGMGSMSPSREAIQELRTFIEESMRRFHVRSPEANIEWSGGIHMKPEFTVSSDLDKRLALEEEVAAMPYLLDLATPRIKQPLFVSTWWLVVGAVCLLRGGQAMVAYLGWEQAFKIVVVLAIAGSIHKVLQKLVRAPENYNSNAS